MPTPKAVVCCRHAIVNEKDQLIYETPAGQRIILQDGPATIVVEDSNGNSLKLDSTGITILSASKVTISASQIELTASMLTVDAGMAQFSGVVQAQTVIATTIVPGSGNTW